MRLFPRPQKRHILHRDVKPENILYGSDGTLKLTDFGTAIVLGRDSTRTAPGTPMYVAPEVLSGGRIQQPIDMWSAGVVLYLVLCGFPPFDCDEHEALFEAIKEARYGACTGGQPAPRSRGGLPTMMPPRWLASGCGRGACIGSNPVRADFPSPECDGLSPGARQICGELLTLDSEARLRADAVLAHSWVAQPGWATGAADSAPNNQRQRHEAAIRRLRKVA